MSPRPSPCGSWPSRAPTWETLSSGTLRASTAIGRRTAARTAASLCRNVILKIFAGALFILQRQYGESKVVKAGRFVDCQFGVENTRDLVGRQPTQWFGDVVQVGWKWRRYRAGSDTPSFRQALEG